MADWKKMAKTILLADGAIDEREVLPVRFVPLVPKSGG